MCVCVGVCVRSPVEMPPDKVVKFLFGFGVEILKLVHGTELDNVETVGQYQICQRERRYLHLSTPLESY